MITISFNAAGTLNLVRLEFPPSSFRAVHSYLKNLEQMGGCRYRKVLRTWDTDFMPIDTWTCPPHGIINVKSGYPPNAPFIVLWINMRIVAEGLKQQTFDDEVMKIMPPEYRALLEQDTKFGNGD